MPNVKLHRTDSTCMDIALDTTSGLVLLVRMGLFVPPPRVPPWAAASVYPLDDSLAPHLLPWTALVFKWTGTRH